MSSADPQELGARLKEEVQKLGGASAVAEKLGVHRNTVQNWFGNGGVSAEALAVLSQHGMDVLYVLTGQRNVMATQSAAIETTARWLSRFDAELQAGELFPKIRVTWMDREFRIDPNDYRWVPVLNVHVAGGMGLASYGEHVVAWNAYRKEWLEAKGLLEAILSEVTVEGPSMEPVLRDGETVLVNHSATEIRGGDIYVIRINDDLVVKYLQRLPNDRLEVSSENSTAFRPYEISMDELGNSIDIIGRVVPRGLHT